ncbi:hypothetical protein CFP56_009187 [Quercus suber]|uniref:Uncharacterized protein n=1 Tax=Quercus suber TaxID=58331 RepID=A0AAW0L1B9_QUESU
MYILTPPPSNETTQRITQLEIALASKEQLAQLEARHEEQLAQFDARLQEQLAQLDARVQEQMREVTLQMREMLSQFSPHMCSSHLFQDGDDFED